MWGMKGSIQIISQKTLLIDLLYCMHANNFKEVKVFTNYIVGQFNIGLFFISYNKTNNKNTNYYIIHTAKILFHWVAILISRFK